MGRLSARATADRVGSLTLRRHLQHNADVVDRDVVDRDGVGRDGVGRDGVDWYKCYPMIGDDNVRVGTWNMQGRWTPAHRALLQDHACDVWLLTEVNQRLEVPGHCRSATTALMAPGRFWAAVLTGEQADQLADPHPASAAVAIGAIIYCSSILPWRSCGPGPPWRGERHGDKTINAVAALGAALPASPLVWGGDWNHALSGKEYAGSIGGRAAVIDMLTRRQLQVPTRVLPHRIRDLLSIDHVAISQTAHVTAAQRFDADGLSDHDAYLIDIDHDANSALA
jgi:hypothetical protein